MKAETDGQLLFLDVLVRRCTTGEVFLHGGECAEFEELKRLSPDVIEMIIGFAYNGRIEITEVNLGELLHGVLKTFQRVYIIQA
ncbi:hypothetical protein SprV_0301298700 [Sparganum proliferum]